MGEGWREKKTDIIVFKFLKTAGQRGTKMSTSVPSVGGDRSAEWSPAWTQRCAYGQCSGEHTQTEEV